MAQTITLAQVLADALKLSDADKHTLTMTLVALGTNAPADTDNGKGSAPNSTSAPTRTYEPATDVTLTIAMVDLPDGFKREDGTACTKAFTLKYGAGRAGAKALIKDAGFAWSASANAYCGTDKAYKALNISGRGKERTLPVSAQWVQAGRDKAAEKQAKREAKRA